MVPCCLTISHSQPHHMLRNHRTADGLLVNCLDEDQARVAMGEVQDGLYENYQSAHKIKWMLRRPGFCQSRHGKGAWRLMRDSSVGTQDEVDASTSWVLLANYDQQRLQILQGMWSLPKVWRYYVGAGFHAKFYYEIVAVQRLGAWLYWHDSPGFIKRASVRIGGDYFTKWSEAIPLRNMAHGKVI